MDGDGEYFLVVPEPKMNQDESEVKEMKKKKRVRLNNSLPHEEKNGETGQSINDK